MANGIPLSSFTVYQDAAADVLKFYDAQHFGKSTILTPEIAEEIMNPLRDKWITTDDYSWNGEPWHISESRFLDFASYLRDTMKFSNLPPVFRGNTPEGDGQGVPNYVAGVKSVFDTVPTNAPLDANKNDSALDLITIMKTDEVKKYFKDVCDRAVALSDDPDLTQTVTDILSEDSLNDSNILDQYLDDSSEITVICKQPDK